MAQRERLQISLFPFMSILACTIGSLTFLLVTMAMTSLGATRLVAEEEDRRATVWSERLRPIEASLAAVDDDAQALAEAEAALERLDAALEQRGLGAGTSLEAIAAELVAADRSLRLAQQEARIDAELAALSKQRDAVEASVSVLESRRETLPILIDPTGISRGQMPYFVECDAAGATAYRVRDDFEYFVPRAELSTSGDFGRYLRRVRALPGALLVLLVREDGIGTARRIEQLARGATIRVARLPLPGQGELDFRLLRRAEGEG
jgi:multidrug efflux pump subunit AcrA (membrane-fusion protein)